MSGTSFWLWDILLPCCSCVPVMSVVQGWNRNQSHKVVEERTKQLDLWGEKSGSSASFQMSHLTHVASYQVLLTPTAKPRPKQLPPWKKKTTKEALVQDLCSTEDTWSVGILPCSHRLVSTTWLSACVTGWVKFLVRLPWQKISELFPVARPNLSKGGGISCWPLFVEEGAQKLERKLEI